MSEVVSQSGTAEEVRQGWPGIHIRRNVSRITGARIGIVDAVAQEEEAIIDLIAEVIARKENVHIKVFRRETLEAKAVTVADLGIVLGESADLIGIGKIGINVAQVAERVVHINALWRGDVKPNAQLLARYAYDLLAAVVLLRTKQPRAEIGVSHIIE